MAGTLASAAFQVIFSSQAQAADTKPANPSIPARTVTAPRFADAAPIVLHDFITLLFHPGTAFVKNRRESCLSDDRRRVLVPPAADQTSTAPGLCRDFGGYCRDSGFLSGGLRGPGLEFQERALDETPGKDRRPAGHHPSPKEQGPKV